MDKVLYFKEFDNIICNPEYKNSPSYKYMEEKEFQKLKDFVRSAADNVNDDNFDFFKVTRKRGVGDVITCQNYVGLIRFDDGLQVQILPKVDLANGEESDEVKTEKTFLRMLQCLKDFKYKVSGMANLSTKRLRLMEVFIKLYIDEVDRLVKEGLKSAYIDVEDNLNCYKGRMLFNENIKYNLVHKERFYVAFDEYHINRPVNKIVKATLKKLASLSTNSANIRDAKTLLNAFDEVDESVNYEKDFSQLKLDRNMTAYEDLVAWSRIFLFNQSFTTFSGVEKAVALLYPMEKLFEAYVAKKMKKVFSEWKVSAQDQKYHLFTMPTKKFRLKPDIVLTKGDRVVVMDTKWKRLTPVAKDNYGISQADMYQMYAYSKKYGASEIWLLYPYNENMHQELVFETGELNNTKVKLFFVDIANIEDSLQTLKNKVEQ